ncbi:MAG: hypothetical protein V1726_00815 [Methanobacteriota archaeon]
MFTLVVRNKTKRTFLPILAIIVAIILIAVGFYVYVEFWSKKPVTPEPEPEEKPIDDRISPLENQELIFEINRMRNRGIIDVMLKPGLSWRNPPSFYYITNMDGLEYIGKDVASAGGVKGENLFTMWDTMFYENKINRDVEEEQATADVSLTIMERHKTGLLGLRTQDIEKEKFTVTYDFRTGRWSGDDSFNDSDGFGHYIGPNYEIWFNLYQNDYDFDGIPYWTEVNVLGTDPMVDDSKRDPNGDGIPLFWDWKWGYDPFGYDNHSLLDPDIDGLTNLQEYIMANRFADPFHQDIYLEADGMQKGGLFDPAHVFWVESQQIMIERFAQHNICLYIDYGWPNNPVNGGGELLEHYETLSQDSGMMLQYYKNHFPDERKGIFRYVVVGHNAGFCHPSEFNNYDSMAVDTSLYKALLKRKAFTPRTQRIVLASATMHELGHSLNIARWTVQGCDNLSFADSKQAKQEFLDRWGNYKSVMSYYYIWDKKIVDYSDGSHGTGDSNDWANLDLTYFKQQAQEVEDPAFKFVPPRNDNSSQI